MSKHRTIFDSRSTAFSILAAILATISSTQAAESIQDVTVGVPVPVPDNWGDTWMPAWTKSGDLVSPSNDSNGFKNATSGNNIVFNQILGDQPDKLTGKTLNVMAEYGRSTNGPDGASWKSSGFLSLDGTLYWVVARHKYGESSGDSKKRQPAANASIIKSTDGGKTWTRSAKENYDHPMFPGNRFAAAYFINYGQDGHEAVADGSDKYVYALSNNGFWDNGDDVVLGRVLKSRIGDQSGADWQYFTHGDGALESAWTSEMKSAQPVLSNPDHLGMTGAVYLPRQKCYFMVGWYYPAGGGKLPNACTTTTWDFYTAPRPWGPWRNVGSHTWTPQGFYCPQVCPKFTSEDGSKLWVFTAGNWNNSDVYRLTGVPLNLK
jgi:hypothetical protein